MGYDVCGWGSSLGIIRLRVLGLRFLAVRGDCASAIVRLRSIVDRRLSSDANIMKAHPMSGRHGDHACSTFVLCLCV